MATVEDRVEQLFYEKTISSYGAWNRLFDETISNMRFKVDGEKAQILCYLLDWLTVDGKCELLSPGEYDCEAVRTAEGWKLRRRDIVMG